MTSCFLCKLNSTKICQVLYSLLELFHVGVGTIANNKHLAWKQY